MKDAPLKVSSTCFANPPPPPKKKFFKVFVVAERITPLASKLEGKNKRDFSKAMDIDEEGTAETPKR